MTRRGPAVSALAGLAVHGLLLAGAGAALPAGARVALAAFALVLGPGFAWSGLIAAPPGGAALAAGWGLGFGIAWNAALVLAATIFGLPFTVLTWGALLPNAALALAAWRWQAPPRPAAAWPRWASALLLLAVVLGAWHAARLGPPFVTSTDTPDHVATVRRMMAKGDAFPTDAYFRDAGEAGRDPRKGLWHPQIACVARLSGTDPIDTWRWLPALLVPLFVVNAAIFGFLLRGPAGAGFAGAALLLTYAGSLAEPYLREAVFSTKLADQLALATAAAVLADLEAPARRTRIAAAALALATVTTHLFGALQFAFVFGALGLGLLVHERGLGPRARRLLGTGLALALACAPYVAWRATHSYAPVNVIHTEPQGMMVLGGGARIVPVGVLWDWLGVGWLLFVFAWPLAWREGRSRPAVLFLATTPLAYAVTAFNPPLIAWLEPRLGYLLHRLVWVLPFAPLQGWLVPRLIEAARGPRRGLAVAGLAGVALLTLPALADTWLALSQAGRFARAEAQASHQPWADGLAWLDRELPPGRVVLSDPVTSYTIPMATRHFVVTLVDQHSSPNDPHALRRLRDARDALDGWSSWDRVREVVDRYGVDVVVLNDRLEGTPRTAYWGADHRGFTATRARLDAAPAAFPRVHDAGDFVVYRVDRAALDTLATAVPARANVRPFVSGRGPVAQRMGDGLPALQIARVGPAIAAPGETLTGIADWRALEPLPLRSYHVSVRFDRELPEGFRPPGIVEKPARKVLERLRGERYRFRDDHLPVGGAYGVDLWRPGTIVRDSFAIVVPRDVAEGAYAVQIRMIAEPIYPNYRLSDLFSDTDYYTGHPIGTLLVARDAPARRREHARRLEESARSRGAATHGDPGAAPLHGGR